MRVDAVGLADRAHLVGEADLERVKRVVRVLRHLGDRHGYPVDDAGKPLVERRHRVGGELVACADDRLRRIVEVAHRRALAQELRVHGDAEVGSGAQTRGGLEARDERALAGARAASSSGRRRYSAAPAWRSPRRSHRRRARGRRSRASRCRSRACRRRSARARSPPPPPPHPSSRAAAAGATASATSSPIRSSTIVERPCATIATLSWLGSTPITSCPRSARQAAETIPT